MGTVTHHSHRTAAYAAVLAAGVLATGCQGAGTPATAPVGSSSGTEAPLQTFAQGQAGASAMGLWQVEVTSEGAALSPVRTGRLIGDSYAIDITGFFTQDPCSTCLRITHFELPAPGEVAVDFTLRHPFPTTATRTDLDVFDPRLIVVAPLRADYGALDFPNTPGVVQTPGGLPQLLRSNTKLLLNAHGYTTRFGERAKQLLGVSWDGNLHPYINYAEDLDPGPGVLPNPNHRLSQTATPETQTFRMTLPTAGTLQFAMLLEASYGESATKPTRQSPTYYLPEFNRKEAYFIEAEFPLGDQISRAHGSILPMRIRVADWQQTGTVDTAYPDPSNPGGLKQSSGVERVLLEAPTLFTGALTNLAPFTGSGTQADPLRYDFTLNRTRNLPPPPGPAPVLATVVDELHGQVQSVPTAIGDYGYTQDVRAYHIFYVDVTPVDDLRPLSPAYTQFRVGTVPQAAYTGGPEGRPDIAVYNNGSGISGVYIPDATNVLRRYPVTYGIEDFPSVSSNVLSATGTLPFDDYAGTNPHPAPGAFMPIRAISATNNGSVILAFDDPNFTMNPGRISGNPMLVELPNDCVVTFFDNTSGTLNASPRIIANAGSAGAPGAPAYGERVMAVAAPGTGFLNAASPLAWLAGGPATELAGDTVRWFMWNAPYSNATNRLLSGEVDNAVLSSPMPSAWTDLVAFDIGTLDTSLGYGIQYLWIADKLGKLHILDILTMILDGRRSDPPLLATTNIGHTDYEIADAAILEYRPGRPVTIGAVTQDRDWLVVLHRNLIAGDEGGILELWEYDPGAGFTRVLLLDGVGGTNYPPLDGHDPVAVDVDNVNAFIHITLDQNGIATPGGDVLVTVLGVL